MVSNRSRVTVPISTLWTVPLWIIRIGFGSALFFFFTDPSIELLRVLAGYHVGRVPARIPVVMVALGLSLAFAVGGLCGRGFERLSAAAQSPPPSRRRLARVARFGLLTMAVALLLSIAALRWDARFRRSHAAIAGQWAGLSTSVKVTREGTCELSAGGPVSSCELTTFPPPPIIGFEFREPRWGLSGSCTDARGADLDVSGEWRRGKLELTIYSGPPDDCEVHWHPDTLVRSGP